jgi:hypothetical protein
MREIQIKPDNILNAIDQVRDPDLEASDYDFLEDVHPAPREKGNDGLANWISLLAIYEKDGKLVVDDDLVDYADEILAEDHGVQDRERISNIVYDSNNRPGKKNSLLENEVNGHARLKRMVTKFKNNSSFVSEEEQVYKDGGSSLSCGNMVNRIVPEDVEELEVAGYNEGEGQPVKPEDNHNGGEFAMGKVQETQEVYEDAVEEGIDEVDAQVQALQNAYQRTNDVEEALDEVREVVDEVYDEAVEKYAEISNQLGYAEGVREIVEQELDQTEQDVEDHKDYLIG